MLEKARGANRLFTAANGPSSLTLGILPLARFLNGHTYFVQVAGHTSIGPRPPRRRLG